MTLTNLSWRQKSSLNTSWCQKVRHGVIKYVMMSTISSWRQIMSLSQKYIKQTRHGVKNIVIISKTHHAAQKLFMASETRHDIKKFVKTSSWRQKSTPWHRIYVMTSKLRHDVNNFRSYLNCQYRFLFAFVLRIIWHQFDIYMMCRSQVINDCVIKSCILPITQLSSFITINPYITKLQYNIYLRTHIYTGKQIDRETPALQ